MPGCGEKNKQGNTHYFYNFFSYTVVSSMPNVRKPVNSTNNPQIEIVDIFKFNLYVTH